MKKNLLFLVPFAFAFRAAYGDVTLPPMISDNMLLQSANAAVWGKADPGENVTVELGKTVVKTTADKDGKWRVKLQGLKPGAAGELHVNGNNKLVVQNVAVGDVWVCSGQSNMAMSVERSQNPKEEIGAANFPLVRMFTVARKPSETPLEQVEGKWELCTPETVGKWSAAGYFFGRQLHKDLGIPIGLIHSAWGGTPAQSWTPTETLQADPDFKVTYYDKRQKDLADFPAAQQRYETQVIPRWKQAVEKAKAEGKPAPRKPNGPVGPNGGPTVSALYNGMIAGLTPYAIKGAIWYQGEANAAESERYHRLLPAMVKSWRKAWGQGDFPFYIVQLAGFMAPTAEPIDSKWAGLREAQRLVSIEMPNSGLAVAIDIGDPVTIHPLNKQEVGRRLALVAQAKTYGKKIVHSGPFLDSVKFSEAKATVSFKPGTAAGLSTTDKGPVKSFAIAGEDKKFVWADAQIVAPKPATKSKKGTAQNPGPTVVLSSSQVPNPVAVRYAWANLPDVNLVNDSGLPAVPFRTDNWEQNEPKPVTPPKPTPTPAPTPVASPVSVPAQ